MKFDSTIDIDTSDNAGYYYGFRFANFYLDKPGKYVFSADYYTDLDPEVATTSNTCSFLWNKTHLKDDDYGNLTTTFTGTNRREWVHEEESLIITQTDGQLYIGSNAIENMPSFLWYMRKVGTVATDFSTYLDSVALQRFAPVTVNVVDDKGTTLATYDVYQNDTITLPASSVVSYNSTLTYDGTAYDFGGNFVVPADAASEITITAERKAMPAHLPANTVLYEDFQNRTVGETTSQTIVSYTTKTFDGTTIAKDWYTPVSHTYEYAPGSTDNITEKFVIGGTYHDGRKINIPNDIPVGKYTVYTNFYVDDVTTDTDDVDSDSNTTEYLHSVQDMHRVWVGSEYAEISMQSYNTADKRQTWVTDSFSFEIAENAGIRSMKMNSKELTIDSGEDLYIMLHWTVGNTSYNNPAIYHDDIYITCVEPETIAATFVDENGEAFAYEISGLYYDSAITLPSAETMGIDYLVEFVGEDGKTYYPGMTYTFEEGATTAEFVVKKTNVVFYEDFENKSKKNAWLTPTYAAGPMAGATVYGNRIDNNVNGTNAYVFSVAGVTANSTPDTIKVNLTQPGIYKITMDAELLLEKQAETDLVDDSFYVNFQTIGDWNTTCSNVYLREGELKKTISGYIELFEDSDGTIKYRLVSHTGSVRTTAITQLRVGLIWSAAFRASTEQKATYHMSFDNIKIEYTPMAPVNTMKASYRELNEGETGGPEGIRFAAYVSNNQRELASEYGFVVTLKDNLPTTDGVTDYTKLNLKGIDSVSATVTTTGKNSDGVTVVAAAAYNGTVDRVYVQDGKVFGLQGLYDTFYTAVLYGIDTEVRKKAVFVARPYAKIDGIYYYGDCHETSYNDVKAAAEAANA